MDRNPQWAFLLRGLQVPSVLAGRACVCMQPVGGSRDPKPGLGLRWEWHWLVLRKSEPGVLGTLLETLTHKSLLTLTWTPSRTCSGVFSQHAAADIHLCVHTFLQ